MTQRAIDPEETGPELHGPDFRIIGHPRPPRPGIFRRRMILQLTSLLDLLLIIVFVQYLEMQEISSRAIARQTELRQQAEVSRASALEQRDRLLAARDHNLSEVWELHLNGSKSVYPDSSVLISSAAMKKVIQPTAGVDLVSQLVSAMKEGPSPKSPCILLLTYGNVEVHTLDDLRSRLELAINDPRLQTAWGNEAIKFKLVEGDYAADPQ